MLPDPKIVVPNFARLDEYAGAWMIEQGRGRYLADWASRQDWHAHVAQAKPMAARSSLETIATSGQDKTLAVVRLSGVLMKQVSSGTDGTSTIQARRDLRGRPCGVSGGACRV